MTVFYRINSITRLSSSYCNTLIQKLKITKNKHDTELDQLLIYSKYSIYYINYYFINTNIIICIIIVIIIIINFLNHFHNF